MKFFSKRFFDPIPGFAFLLIAVGIVALLSSEVSYAAADLKVMQVKLDPFVPVWNDTEVKISATIKNIGDAKPSRKSSLQMWIRSVKSKTEKKDVVPGTILSSNFGHPNNIPRLNPDDEVVITTTLPPFIFAGWHWIQMQINTEGFLEGEEIHQNNFYERWFSVKARPDLVICFKKHNVSRRYAKNYYPVNIKNIGTKPSPECRLSFQIDDKGTKKYKVHRLNPGQERSEQREVYWGWKDLGVHSFQIRIACETGSNEKRDNNKFEGYIRVPRLIDMKTDPWKNTKTVCSDTFQ